MYSVSRKRRKLIDKVKVGKKQIDGGIEYDVFTFVPKDLRLSKFDVGKRVWLSEDTRTTEATLYKYHDIGEESWPDGGYEIKIKGIKYPRSFFYDEVILHPSEIKLTEKEKQKNKKIRSARMKKYKNPLTGRKCSYKYSLKNGFITETGKKIPLKDMKFENPETGNEVSYNYAKRKGII